MNEQRVEIGMSIPVHGTEKDVEAMVGTFVREVRLQFGENAIPTSYFTYTEGDPFTGGTQSARMLELAGRRSRHDTHL